MFLAIDIGNTTTMMGIFSEGKLMGDFRVKSSHAVTADECGILTRQLLQFHSGGDGMVKKIGISSVVPPLTQIYESMSQKYFKIKPEILSHKTKVSFKNLYDDPSEVGADRIANVEAAKILYGYPAVIIDLGTAITYDVLDKDGNYQGGAISPGLWISVSSLFNKASRLFPVNIEKPEKVIGKDTACSMKSGIFYAFLGQLEYMIKIIKSEMRTDNLKVIMTGGYADMFTNAIDEINHYDSTLTLKGLELIFNK